MAHGYTCDACKGAIEGHRMVSVGLPWTSSLHFHPECAPQVVELLQKMNARDIEGILPLRH